MDIYGFGCNCCHSFNDNHSNNNYNEITQRINDKKFDIIALRFEIEEMKRNGVSQVEINKRINELKNRR